MKVGVHALLTSCAVSLPACENFFDGVLLNTTGRVCGRLRARPGGASAGSAGGGEPAGTPLDGLLLVSRLRLDHRRLLTLQHPPGACDPNPLFHDLVQVG